MAGAPWTIADQVRLQRRSGTADVDFLRDIDGIVDFDTKVADGALDLRVAEQEDRRRRIAAVAVLASPSCVVTVPAEFSLRSPTS